jgi:hypothetical protein
MTAVTSALSDLLCLLKERRYRFVTPTPATHIRVISRRDRRAQRLEDVLGWNLPFETGLLDEEIEGLLRKANAITQHRGMWRSLIRVSSLRDCLCIHSAFPTEDRNAAFFGPDSYRFADLITSELPAHALGKDKLIVDVGAGVGVGAIIAGKICPEARLCMTEINPIALEFARINVEAAGIQAKALLTDCVQGIEDIIDLALANPPYLMDPHQRLYRNGGKRLGAQVTIDMARFILPRLSHGGRFILYSGSAILAGRDEMELGLRTLAHEHGCMLQYRELDPDVFGEELEHPAYAEVDRIALIAAVFERD